jgi:Na+/H+-dicarboxylate symporter
MRRWILFLLSILIGIAIGLLYGWIIHPTQYMDTSLDTLRMDYKTDYVLMIAETYALLGDPDSAVGSLADLAPLPPLEIIHQAILYAEQAGYNVVDLDRMRSLQSALGNPARLSTPLP